MSSRCGAGPPLDRRRPTTTDEEPSDHHRNDDRDRGLRAGERRADVLTPPLVVVHGGFGLGTTWPL
jgi:hypothetical protein